MKSLMAMFLFFAASQVHAVEWTYQVNVNNNSGTAKQIDAGKNSFDAGPHYCEVTPVIVNNNTEYRSVVCAVGTGTVSTGALCTRKGAKVASVQYAILNLTGPKNLVNVVVACKF